MNSHGSIPWFGETDRDGQAGMASISVSINPALVGTAALKGVPLDAFLAGGPDGNPLLTFRDGKAPVQTFTYNGDESLHLCALIPLPGVGEVLGATGNLMVGTRVYSLLLELFRGKLCRIQNQASDWQLLGLELPTDILQRLRQLTHRLVTIVTSPNPVPEDDVCLAALAEAHVLGNDLTDVYIHRLFELRTQKQGPLSTVLSVGMPEDLEPVDFKALGSHLAPFDHLHLPLSWRALEPEPGKPNLAKLDLWVEAAKATGKKLTAGPLLDFRAQGLPDWVLKGSTDPHQITALLSKHVRHLIASHGSHFDSWTVLLGANLSEVFDFDEDEWLRMAYHLCDEAKRAGKNLKLSLGVSQPWGEIMSIEHRNHSPFSFAETVVRTGLPIASIALDMVMGTLPRGGYVRDGIETSKMIDQFAFLGKPLKILTGFPSSSDSDLLADSTVRLAGGHLGLGHSPKWQALWAETMLPLMLSKAAVQEVRWCHLDDRRPHTHPNCGLIDSKGNANPTLEVLKKLKAQYLK